MTTSIHIPAREGRGFRVRAGQEFRVIDPEGQQVADLFCFVADDPSELVALAGMLALLVAAIEIGLGLGKLGFVADLLSKEVQVGYMIGLGITIIVTHLALLIWEVRHVSGSYAYPGLKPTSRHARHAVSDSPSADRPASAA